MLIAATAESFGHMRTDLPIRRLGRPTESQAVSRRARRRDLFIRHKQHEPPLHHPYVAEPVCHMRPISVFRELLHRISAPQTERRIR
jgi:hypothetical protein